MRKYPLTVFFGFLIVAVIDLNCTSTALNETQTAIEKEGKAYSVKPDAPAADPLVVLNTAFRNAHKRARKEMLARSSPVIVVGVDKLVLLRNEQRIEVEFTPTTYHTVKAVSHIAPTLYLMLASLDKDILILDTDRLSDLHRYRELVVLAENSLSDRGLEADLLERQQKIITMSLTFLDNVITTRKVSRGELADFTHQMTPLLLANAVATAHIQLDALHTQMEIWRHQLTDAEWQRLHVVVMGSHQARKDHISMQYFSYLIEESFEGRRLIYSEQFNEEDALNLLAAHMVDRGMSTTFFGDEMRMHRDFLADGGVEYIKKLSQASEK